MSNSCPVCGYPNLDKPAYSDEKGAWPSLEICPCCGFQFGFTDHSQHITFEQWREQWIARGMLWQSIGIARPADWNPTEQLLKIREKT